MSVTVKVASWVSRHGHVVDREAAAGSSTRHHRHRRRRRSVVVDDRADAGVVALSVAPLAVMTTKKFSVALGASVSPLTTMLNVPLVAPWAMFSTAVRHRGVVGRLRSQSRSRRVAGSSPAPARHPESVTVKVELTVPESPSAS